MAKKLPKIYQPEFTRQVNPNKDVFYSYQRHDAVINQKESSNPINQLESVVDINSKIDQIFKRGNGFSKLVEITTSSGVEQVKLAGRIKNHLITLENKIIPLDDIMDIKLVIPNAK